MDDIKMRIDVKLILDSWTFQKVGVIFGDLLKVTRQVYKTFRCAATSCAQLIAAHGVRGQCLPERIAIGDLKDR